MNYVLIFAGGVGKRMHTQGVPKQFLEVFGKPIIVYTIEHFQRHNEIDNIVVVCVSSHIKLMESLIVHYQLSKVSTVVQGGSTGQESIRNGLLEIEKTASADDIVLIHDGVRPIIDEELISRNIASVKQYGSAISSSDAIETFCLAEPFGRINTILPRTQCIVAKAPQSFRVFDILKCHRQAMKEGKIDFIDSADLMKSYGHELHYVPCTTNNIKITTSIDYYIFKGILNAQESMQVMGM